MSKLHEIPIVVAAAPPAFTPEESAESTVLALLCEIEAKLDALLGAGEPSTIDLRWLMASPQTLERLREALGKGEVEARIAGSGISLLQETAVPCVWRVSHRDSDDHPTGEFVEITDLPELLRSDRLAIPQGLAALRARCAQAGESSTFSSMPSPREFPS